MSKVILYILTSFFIFLTFDLPLTAQKIIYVSPADDCYDAINKALKNGENTDFEYGSWEEASSDLQLAIDAAEPGDKIFVARGTYLPNFPVEYYHQDSGSIESRISEVFCYQFPTNSFFLKSEVKVYGGFEGWESDENERNLQNSNNRSVLTGLLENGDRVNHVVMVIDCNEQTVLGGFSIINGRACHKNKQKGICRHYQVSSFRKW